MTTQEKLVKRKLSLIELSDFLKKVSQDRRINGVSRQHFYDIKKAYDEPAILINDIYLYNLFFNCEYNILIAYVFSPSTP